MRSFTENQRQAIEREGNILVMAGAGAGKTSVLVERCLARLLAEADPASLEEILMVTFTEAAAAQMKLRIRERLTEELARAGELRRRRFLEEQLALVDTAPVGTLHSFCLQLLREQFHELDIDPQVMVLGADQAAVLQEEVLEEILGRHCGGGTAESAAVLELIAVQGRGDAKAIGRLVLRVHEYAETLADREGWHQKQRWIYQQSDPVHWREWLERGFEEWRDLWLPVLDGAEAANAPIQSCRSVLATCRGGVGRQGIGEAIGKILVADEQWPARKRTVYREPYVAFFEEARFLHSLAVAGEGEDPLAADWDWCRGQMLGLLGLAEEFAVGYAAAKRRQSAVDFHDLEQLALRLLWDGRRESPTSFAGRYRDRFQFVFVDEYQDINAAQDAILAAVSSGGALGNRFLVGDIKQSIYRFRLADPAIFRRYHQVWGGDLGLGQVISLSENFRSREGILDFINPLFRELMCEAVGGVAYDSEAELRFGAGEERRGVSRELSGGPCVEVHLCLSGGNGRAKGEGEAEGGREGGGGGVDWAEMTQAEVEAQVIGDCLRRLVEEGYEVWDSSGSEFRRVRWGDMVILLRAPFGKAAVYAKEFGNRGIPFQALRTDYFDNTEVSDLVSLLQLLDNPVQDIPLLAVLRSPLVGMSLDELAEIRLAGRGESLWTALVRWHDIWREAMKGSGGVANELWAKVDEFLGRFRRWRTLGRELSLSRRIEAILKETGYREWLLTEERAKERLANVGKLLEWARQFDPLRRQGLGRFLKFIELQREGQPESEPGDLGRVDAVHLTSIHRSKGLEFPVVVAADLGKRFNLSDLHEAVILDEVYGLCPQIKPPVSKRSYPSLSYWLASIRQRRELLGEELRLLYVALTRARDRLILVGTARESAVRERWAEAAKTGPATAHRIMSAQRYLDWLGPWLARRAGEGWIAAGAGRSGAFDWVIHRSMTDAAVESSGRKVASGGRPEGAGWDRTKARLGWVYPHGAATRTPAKASVSGLRGGQWSDDELVVGAKYGARIFWEVGSEGLVIGAERGTAHHRFLQKVRLSQVDSEALLRAEGARLVGLGELTGEEVGSLDFGGIAAFWQGETGRRIRGCGEAVNRELSFTARFEVSELPGFEAGQVRDEFIIVQGVVDLAVILPAEIWILDFKTDQVQPGELVEKVRFYRPQLDFYGKALSRIYGRPVRARWLHFLAVRETVACCSGLASGENPLRPNTSQSGDIP